MNQRQKPIPRAQQSNEMHESGSCSICDARSSKSRSNPPKHHALYKQVTIPLRLKSPKDQSRTRLNIERQEMKTIRRNLEK